MNLPSKSISSNFYQFTRHQETEIYPAVINSVSIHWLEEFHQERVTTKSSDLISAFNPFTDTPVNALHFAILVEPTIFNFDIRELWRSGLSARAPECQKLEMVG